MKDMADGGFVGKQKHTKVFAAKKDSPQHSRLSLSHGHQQQSEHHDKKSHPKVCFLMALLVCAFFKTKVTIRLTETWTSRNEA